jgi:serine/tyrosine/threonine adenylyltransferase
MYHLGVPTTRALSLVLTGEQVIRDMFYDGHPKSEPGAVVCRVAPSFIRFGSFEIFAARKEIEVLRKLVDYTIRTDFPHLGAPTQSVYVDWFKEICQRTADLLVQWMRVGFVHGVMNTDNMSILGLTIDYGPYGWLEDCDPDWTPNTTDADSRRYRFGQQPQIALWNLHKLANAIHPLIEHTEFLEEALSAYSERYNEKWQSMMAHKLGFKEFESVDDALVDELLAILPLAEIDMTIFYRKLATIDIELKEPEKLSNELLIVPFLEAYYKLEQLTDEYLERMGDWVRFYIMRLKKDNFSNEERRKKMNAVNPKYVLRNYLAQLAIDKAELGDFSMVNELLDVLHYPYDEQPDKAIFSEKRPDWARSRAGCSMLSCSS